MSRLNAVLAAATARLAHLEDPRREAEELLAHCLGCSRLDLYLSPQIALRQQQLVQLQEVVARRARREPLSYIIGAVDFLGCRLRVAPEVFIPRPETEILTALFLEQLPLRGGHVWDLCSGSGAIAIAIKAARPHLHVHALEHCQRALRLAEENGRRNGVTIDWRCGDLFRCRLPQPAAAIICNPPYVSAAEYAQLQPEVLYEPRQALVAPHDPLSFYRHLATFLPGALRPGGRVALEIGGQQGKAIAALFAQSCWRQRQLGKDWAGWERFFFLEFA